MNIDLRRVRDLLTGILVAVVILALWGFIVAACGGCRSADVMTIRLKVPKEAANLTALTITQTMYGCTNTIEQGKVVPTSVLTDPAISASQNGNATSSREGDSNRRFEQPTAAIPELPIGPEPVVPGEIPFDFSGRDRTANGAD